jgi:hypothetical protein
LKSIEYTFLVPTVRIVTRPASFNTLRCCETAGRDTGNPSAISPTGSGFLASRSKISRRVGSARAAKRSDWLAIAYGKNILTINAFVKAAIIFGVIALLLAAFLQQDQTPRAPVKNERGMLPVNRQYFDLAANTGGDFYFWAAGEFASAHLQIPIHGADVLLSYGTMDSKKVFEIPVESGVKELTLFAGVQRKDLAVLVRPDNTPVRDAQVFQHMLIATVPSPPAGIWRLEMDGEGVYAVTAHVKPGDDAPRIAFDGCQSVARGTKDTHISFVTVDGSAIIAREPCVLPMVPYRTVVRGVDGTGAVFQRIDSQLRPPD